MDPESAKLILEGFAAYERGDDRVLRDFFDPDIEIHADAELLNAGTYQGWEGWKRWTSQWEEAWANITYEPLGYMDVGDEIAVIPVRVRGVGRGSGVEVVQENHFIFQVRDGRCVRLHLYATAEQAEDAARQLAAA